ncbi:MAG: hypothetical protein NWQ38_10785, partial [Cellulophaga sp.]|nr:hypothetical protein [Cellulophaga sp.]
NDIVANGVIRMGGLSMTDIENPSVKGNRFKFKDISNYPAINFGTTVGGYTGKIIAARITNNTFTNAGIQFSSLFDVVDSELLIENNVFDYKWSGFNPGNYVGVIRYAGYGVSKVNETVVFKNNVINYNATNNFNLWSGVILSFNSSIENLTLENVEVNYTGIVPSVNFGFIGSIGNSASFNSSNVIKNCLVNGASAIGAIKVSGTDKSVTIENSRDNNGNSITVRK